MIKVQSVLQMGQRIRTQKNKKDVLWWPRNLTIGTLCLISICAVIFFTKSEPKIAFALIALGAGLAYHATCQLQTPFYAVVFKFGKAISEIGPGLHWCLWPWSLNPKSKAQQHIEIPKIELYKKDGTPVSITKGLISFREVDLVKSVMLNEPKRKILNVTLAKLKGEIGQRDFIGKKGLITEQGQIESTIQEDLIKEMEEWGFEIDDVELSDYDERVHSEAKSIKIKGAAEAEVQGKKARAISDPLKDNLPAAIASSAASFSKSIEKHGVQKKKGDKG